MENPIKQIVKFNQDAGLLDRGYDDFLESSFQIEEALEGFNNIHYLAGTVDAADSSPKEVARKIVSIARFAQEGIPDVDRLDKAIDAVVFAVGSMAKLGLNSQQITRAINVVMRCNNQKLGMPKDEHGKLIKPPDFEGPEPELQCILDERV
jgi:predicted HAD superfamily Cof-like phosphohydrolase